MCCARPCHRARRAAESHAPLESEHCNGEAPRRCALPGRTAALVLVTGLPRGDLRAALECRQRGRGRRTLPGAFIPAPRILTDRLGKYAQGRMNRWNEALFDACACERLRPQWQRTHECKGAALEALGRFDEALAEFRKALACAPDSELMQSAVAELSRVATADRAEAQLPLRGQPTVSREQGLDDEIDSDFYTQRDPMKKEYGSVWAETAREGRDRRPPPDYVDLRALNTDRGVHEWKDTYSTNNCSLGRRWAGGEKQTGGKCEHNVLSAQSRLPPVVPRSSIAATGRDVQATEEQQNARGGGELGAHESLVPVQCTSVFSPAVSGIYMDTSASTFKSIPMPIPNQQATCMFMHLSGCGCACEYVLSQIHTLRLSCKRNNCNDSPGPIAVGGRRFCDSTTFTQAR